jgi:hypothetical protein
MQGCCLAVAATIEARDATANAKADNDEQFHYTSL